MALVIGATTYALTASNSVSPPSAGQGTGPIAGYTVSGVAYTLDVTDPRQITQVRFTLNAPPSSAATVQAKLGSSAYAPCAPAGSTATTSTWTCPTSAVASTSAMLLVAAAQ